MLNERPDDRNVPSAANASAAKPVVVDAFADPIPQLLRSGREFFPALIAAIEQARTEVLLETYIFSQDATGDRVAQALAQAARRGLIVKVLIDGFGTRPVPEAYVTLWIEAGVQLQIFSPVPALLTLDRERLRRLHRKLACMDGMVGFVGGINVLDDLWDSNHGVLEHPRLDYAVRVGGRLAKDVQQTMVRLWEQVCAPERSSGIWVCAGLQGPCCRVMADGRISSLTRRRARKDAHAAVRPASGLHAWCCGTA